MMRYSVDIGVRRRKSRRMDIHIQCLCVDSADRLSSYAESTAERVTATKQGVARRFGGLEHARITAGPWRDWDEMLPLTSGQPAEGGAINV
jgi:hypothetical protein